MIKIERILVPTDFSDYSKEAIKYACELAQRFGAELHLFHVVQPLRTHVSYGPPIPDAELFDPEQPARKELEALAEPGLEHVSRVERSVRTGTPFLEIVRCAKDKDVDLIVMGTHGRTGLAHALIGSVAEKVVRKAPCPVLSVRPEGHQFVMP
jgi:nucleotide-binding universal stress UspA family protein